MQNEAALATGLATHGRGAELFSSYVAAAAVSCAFELGILDRLLKADQFDVGDREFAGVHQAVMNATLRSLHWAGVVEYDESSGRVRRGLSFEEVYAARGYIYWLVRGCGELLATAPAVASPEAREGAFYRRDMTAVAIGSRIIGDDQVESLFDSLICGEDPIVVADLGCGSAARLIRIVRRIHGSAGVGIDISSEAVRLASENVATEGLGEVISIRQADVLALRPSDEFVQVDTVTCVFMGHDFWPMDRCVETLNGIGRCFPNANRLLLCDVVQTVGSPDPSTPIFVLGFESIHALMAVPVPTLDEWREAFRASNWRLDRVTSTQSPPNGYLFELARA